MSSQDLYCSIVFLVCLTLLTVLIIQGVLEYVGTTSLVDLTLQNKKKAHINMARYDLVSMIQLYLYYINYLPGFTEIAQYNHFWHEYKLINVSA